MGTVLGTPEYWWGPTAQFKAFVYRWFDAIRKFPFKGKKVVLVLPPVDSDPAAANYAVGMLSRALKYVGAEITNRVLFERAPLSHTVHCAARDAAVNLSPISAGVEFFADPPPPSANNDKSDKKK